MAKIYTKTGDKGLTSLTGGHRVSKTDPLVEAYGTVDEANSMIGFAISKMKDENLKKGKTMLIEVQKTLFHVGAEISTPQGEKVYWPLDELEIERIEKNIDKLSSEIPELKQFILPGGSEAGAALHVARSIVRRAERLAVSVSDNHLVTSYLNRCSDFLFVAARWINQKESMAEEPFTY